MFRFTLLCLLVQSVLLATSQLLSSDGKSLQEELLKAESKLEELYVGFWDKVRPSLVPALMMGYGVSRSSYWRPALSHPEIQSSKELPEEIFEGPTAQLVTYTKEPVELTETAMSSRPTAEVTMTSFIESLRILKGVLLGALKDELARQEAAGLRVIPDPLLELCLGSGWRDKPSNMATPDPGPLRGEAAAFSRPPPVIPLKLVRLPSSSVYSSAKASRTHPTTRTDCSYLALPRLVIDKAASFNLSHRSLLSSFLKKQILKGLIRAANASQANIDS